MEHIVKQLFNICPWIMRSYENRAQLFEIIAQSKGIKDSRNVVRKFRNQFQPLAISVTFWWFLVWESLQGLATDKETAQWLTSCLLPVVYWHHKMEKTKNSKARKKYRKAWEQASIEIKVHPFSESLSISERERWLTSAESMARQLHRNSSAVEGRNGGLSQMPKLFSFYKRLTCRLEVLCDK